MKAELRILHALPVWQPAWQFGGPVRSVARLCEALAARGINIEVVTTTAGLPDWPAIKTGIPLQQAGVTVTYYPVNNQTKAISSRALLSALPMHLARNQLFHLSAVWQPLGLPMQRAAHRAGVPVIHSLRGALGPYSLGQGWWKKIPYYWLFERPCLMKAAALHVTSNRERRETKNLLLSLNNKVPLWQLPNPLDFSNFILEPAKAKLMRQQQRLQLGVSTSEALFLVCGRHHHKKGLDLLEPVLSGLKEFPWKLAIVGPDEDGSAARLEASMQKAGLGGRLVRLPLQPAEQLPALFVAADLLLMPSRHENFGNVALEALACGCPVLVSNAVGVAEELPALLSAEAWGAVLPRQAPLWRNWLQFWLQEWHSKPIPQRVSPLALQSAYGPDAVAAACEQFYMSLLR